MYVILRSECDGPRHKAAGSANDLSLISLAKDLKSKDRHKAEEPDLSLALRFFGHYVPSE